MTKSNKEIFREVNLRRKMDRMFKFSSPPQSFADLKEKSQEVQRNPDEEQENRSLNDTSEYGGHK